ncbi:hypothetical protein [Aromatoleum evansii]|uniref:hypothetical protein n=1 Tax=Aromatoleum evansii TaxID=59406 RepID=UPI00145CEF96|nr:hypothetical protein [Aromatoleum evansii]NMG28249.1 hypothetical protein [Aromatoleum evansii]
MFAFVLRPVVLGVLATALVWALVLGWWRAVGYEPGTVELATHLLLLPATLLAGFWLLRTVIEHLRQPPAATVAHASGNSETRPAAASAPAHRPETYLIAFALQCAHGTEAAQVLDAARQGCAPALDDDLRDAHGFPVFAARVADLSPEDPGGTPHDHSVDICLTDGEQDARALALLHSALPRALDDLAEFIAPAPAIRIVLWLSDREREDAHGDRLATWLRREHLAPRDIAATDVRFHHPRDDAHAFELIDALADELDRLSSPAFALVLGAVSHVDERTVAAWEAASDLFTASTQDGRIPGEAAAVLVLANRAGAALVGRLSSPRLSHAASGRVSPADASRAKAGAPLLGSLIDAILTDTQIDAARVSNVLADADHRAPITKDLLRTLSERFPTLEPLADMLSLGNATGFSAPIGGLVTLLCAAEAASANEGVALCLTCQSPNARAAIIVDARPPAPTSPAPKPDPAPDAT